VASRVADLAGYHSYRHAWSSLCQAWKSWVTLRAFRQNAVASRRLLVYGGSQSQSRTNAHVLSWREVLLLDQESRQS
jgi:hypothetical protein